MSTSRRSELPSTLPLVSALAAEVEAWSSQGWGSGVTDTTQELLRYWFERDEESLQRFYLCQQRAIETVIYCHEVLQARTLRELYERLAPEVLLESLPLKSEIESIPFPKYCLKMATGSGKTWVLAGVLVWQYFNHLNRERDGWYSDRFLVVAPGHEVLNRLLDSFHGKRDPKTQERDPGTADYKRALFMPDGALWRDRFHVEILEPSAVRANTTPPDGSFAFLTNWQQFRLKGDKPSLWQQYTGEDVEDQPRGEVILDFLSAFPDLIVMNDEAHHVHGKRTARDEELVWRRFMGILHERLYDTHGEKAGPFVQFDFSATPFYGSGQHKDYFPHIAYDYDLIDAMGHMLVKQLFLEERQSVAGTRPEDLDFRAERTEPEGSRRRGQVLGLSAGQKLLLDIGRKKLEQLAQEFRERGIQRKPVLMVLCEETKVAQLVEHHFATLADELGNPYDESRVMRIHTPDKEAGFTEAHLKAARQRLDKIDDDDDPLRVVVSVLMLREGFDKTNICVTVVLRASEADLLLEQIVGRGLRLMFPEWSYPEFDDAKKEAYRAIRRGRTPDNSLDFLFVVEHPRFRKFYDELRRQGYAFGEGDTTAVRSTGDLEPVDAMPSRIPEYDLAFLVQYFERGKPPDLKQIDASQLPRYQQDFATLKKLLGQLMVTDRHVPTDVRARTWKLDNRYFDYNFFLGQAARAVATEGRESLLTSALADIAAMIDEYASEHLFGQPIDFTLSENYAVLNYALVFDHVVSSVRRAVTALLGEIRYETQGVWKRLSDAERIMVRRTKAVDTNKSIYPRLPYSDTGGGFERDFMREVLGPSAEVIAYCKLDRKHGLTINYRDEHGILRPYEVDFLVKTGDRMCLVETKADRDIDAPRVALKARASHAWCEKASTVPPPSDLPQPEVWEYLILSESLFKDNPGVAFEALVPLMRGLRDRIIAQSTGHLL